MNKYVTETKRRQILLASGAGLVMSGLGIPGVALANTKLRQGFQTNMWGMPTYYLLKSGALKKAGIDFEEFAVPSGNLTMQQMVARQVDLGTYAGPSFVIGHDKGGLVAIAVIEYVGRTASVMARKELNITKVEQLKGLKIANQTGSSIANIFMNSIAPKYGLSKDSFSEIRMNVNDMVAAMASKTVDAMVNIEPYNSIAEADGLATMVVNYYDFDRMPVVMAATPEFIEKNPDMVVSYLKAWLDVAKDFETNPAKVSSVIHEFYTSKGYTMSKQTLQKALAKIEVKPQFPADFGGYMQEQAEILLKANRIKAIPDWKKALRPEFMQKALKA
ncbi:MAG: ABC transporter substrate-binding protein [Burkholderiales bacterium]|jgi:ABC-type nitrate/sulfonate/bicarbonate transport system substrate-binding protein